MDLVSLSNPLSFEGVLSDIFEDNGEETPLKKAQDIMYDAWEVTDPKRRVALARRELEISPDCADAYIRLGIRLGTGLSKLNNSYLPVSTRWKLLLCNIFEMADEETPK